LYREVVFRSKATFPTTDEVLDTLLLLLSFFEKVYVDTDGVAQAKLAQPFTHVLPKNMCDSVQDSKTPADNARRGV